MNASPTKLRSGSWGATVEGSVSVGDVVTITTRAGKSWDAKVSHIVWMGSGKSIVATQSLDDSGSHARRVPNRKSSTRCYICHGPLDDCSYERAQAGMCGSCAYDEI